MIRSLYIAGTGMQLQRRKMENITNNITNVETVGYKKEILVSRTFDDVMIRRINEWDNGVVGPLNLGTHVDEIFTDFKKGNFEDTGLDTDIAILGDAFFVMETPEGERYSGSGAFVRTSDGYLTNGDGNYLLGTNGRVYVGDGSFAVDGLGNVTVEGQVVNRIRLVSFENNSVLRKQGHNLYYADGGAPYENTAVAMKQGFLEGSNVDAGRELVDMMSVYRAYETNQRMLTMIDETLGKAVNEIASLR